MKKIYFDHSATTPLDKEVFEAMEPYMREVYGNPSSIHNFGQAALAGVDKSRKQLAKYLNCEAKEVAFTSGATESDNLAVRGLIAGLKKKGLEKMHIITSLVEHDAVLEPCLRLEKEGVEVSYLRVDKNGVIDLEELKSLIREETVLVSVMYVNSEVGSVMPIRKIGKAIHNLNESREKEWKKLGSRASKERPEPIYFHTDAVQAVNFFSCDVKDNYLDMLSLSGHKIYGPKGVGALYVKTGLPVEAIQFGGHHERNLRSGTLNVPGIVGLGAAIEQISKENVEKNNSYISKLRNKLAEGVIEKVPDVVLNSDKEKGTPSHAHFSILGVEGEALLISLDMEGIAVSTGSACASGSLKASHVLLAMGIDKEIAHYSVRITLGKHTTEDDVSRFLEIFPPIVEKLRKMNPIYKK